MRLLKFNGELVDIDDQTAIGIDLQGYDITQPGSRKIASSNKFTIPRTANNMRLIGFAGDPQSNSTKVYNAIACKYYNQNKGLIKNGTARVVEVGDRISVFAYDKPVVWSQMQGVSWPDFQNDFITWLQDEKGLPSATSPYVGTFADFVAQYISTTEGIILPFIISNLALYDPDEGTNYVEDTGHLYLKYNRTIDGTTVDGLGGHFCVYVKTIFEYIEDTYNVNLSVSGSEAYNIFADAVASVMYTPLRNLHIEHTGSGFYFRYHNTGKFLPEDNAEDKPEKTLYDFTKAFFQHFNCLIDLDPTITASEKYIIRRFDNITSAAIRDLSGDLVGTPIFSPVLENFKQNNWIKWAKVYEGGSELTNAKKIVCLNQNLDQGSPSDNLFTIDGYIPQGITAGGDVVLDMAPSDSLGSFAFFVSSGNASTTVYSLQEGTQVSAPVILQIAVLYNLSNEYNTIESIAQYPVRYTIKKRLTLAEIEGLIYFRLYYVKELNGYFFLNKIEGYNPEKSTEPAKIELIKIPM